MAKGVNKAIILGNLGQAPEVKYLQDGTAVASISVATSEQWKNKQTGQPESRTEWHRVEAFGKLAEIMGQYLQKGSKVYIEGSIHTRKWQDQSGQDRYTTSIRARDMQMLDSRQDNQQGYQQQPHQNTQAMQQPRQQNAYRQASAGGGQHRQPVGQAAPQQMAPNMAPAQGFDNFDDDIPF